MARPRFSKQKIDVSGGVENSSDSGDSAFSLRNIATLREKRMSMALRAVSFGLFGSVILNITMSYAIIAMLPLKEVRPFLVQVADQGRVAAAIMPIKDTFDAKDILTEKLVRDYVVNRLEILRSDEIMRTRWGADSIMGLMSSAEEYERFADGIEKKVEKIRNLRGEMRVEILNVTPIRVGATYVVDAKLLTFDQRNRLVGEPLEIAVTMDISFLPLKNLNYEQLLINPTGFRVLNFLISEKS